MTVPSASPAPARQRVGSALLALVGLALIGGCAGSQAASGLAEPSPGAVLPTPSSPVATTQAPTGAALLSPLTGLPTTGDTATRPVVGVTVRTGSGLPGPAGLDRADLLYVTFPLPGRQRTVALFQSQDADRVGPVDDTRPIDNKLMVVLRGVLEHAGGSQGFVSRTDAADVPQWSAVVHPSAFAVDAAGQLYGSTAVARATPGTKPAVEGLVAFQAAAPGPAPAPVTVRVATQPDLGLTWDPTSRTWNGAIGALPVRATNVIVQQVTYDRLDLPNTTATEGDPVVFGKGAALVLAAERVLDASWNRAGRPVLNSYVGVDGVPVRLAPGTTVVLLVPTGTPITR